MQPWQFTKNDTIRPSFLEWDLGGKATVGRLLVRCGLGPHVYSLCHASYATELRGKLVTFATLDTQK